MRVIVSDSSCIIDLGKSSLVRAVLQLPYTFVMPDVLFDDELLSFGPVGKRSSVRSAFRSSSLIPMGPAVRLSTLRNISPWPSMIVSL